MANIKNKHFIWNDLPKLDPTPPEAYFNRRAFIKALGLGSVALAATSPLTLSSSSAYAQMGRARYSKSEIPTIERPGLTSDFVLSKFPAKQNPDFVTMPGNVTTLTPKPISMAYNNYYEFTTNKTEVWKLAQDFQPDPWSIEITGECNKPAKLDIDDIFKFPAEQRNYRFRCVEAWAMDVPWTGVPFHKILESVEPTSNAKYVKFTCVERPKQMPGQVNMPWYPWPYFESWRIDEAMNPLVLLVTGLYGQPLPRQNGSPFRMIIPWKYGYKNPKAFVKIELTKERPPTFWNSMIPNEYSWLSNINPKVPHPRWSQATEVLIDNGKRRPTLLYGGYGKYVADLYKNDNA
ncbi:protein-methionine-sulfoxide reductase catalytic subunit MsrP [Planctomycetota bacterium]|nr:protein-methionine-sulfoxide reductase catalytic subunit MsrP [Planctomycetota bacterium]